MYADVLFHEQPDWSRRPGRRLAFNFLPATFIVAGILSVLQLPVVKQAQPLTELFVRILVNELEEVVEPPFVEAAVVDEELTDEPTTESVAPAVVTKSRIPTDWHAQIPDAVAAFIESQDRRVSVNPNFDEKRRRAAEKFRPSEALVEKPIWENVEKDTLGRTVLVSGNCQRVLDDPNVGSREEFLTFGQYITTCFYYRRPPQKLGFVKEILDRRAGRARSGPPAAE